MGTLTLDEMVTRLDYRLGNRTDITDALKKIWINDSYDHVSRPNIHEHRELQVSQDITLATSTNTYSLNSDLDIIFDVFNATQNYKLYPRTIKQFDQYDTTVVRRPNLYTTWGTNLIIDSYPDSGSVGDTVTIRYWDQPTILGDSDTTVLNRRFDEIIVKLGEWRAWDHLGNFERAEEAANTFATLLREVPDIVNEEAKDDGHRAMPTIYPGQRY
jgi:hypothetical protein